MKLRLFAFVAALFLFTCACSPPKKEITVVIRESGSGTREAFDRTVTDGTHFLEEYDENGKKIDRNSIFAVVQTKGGSMLSSVAADRYAIGYLSPATLNDSVRAISVDGVFPENQSVLNGSYPLRRPFVIVTNSSTEPTPLAADFLRYLKSDFMEEHTAASSCIFVSNPQDRAPHGTQEIPVGKFSPLPSLPTGQPIRIRGSTSLELLINRAALGYAQLYGADPTLLFDIQLEGSSVGIKAALQDRDGCVIGLSSAHVENGSLNRFVVAYDALAVIVHPENSLKNISMSQLYNVFSGKVKYFEELELDHS